MKLTDLLDQIDRLDQEATKGPWDLNEVMNFDYLIQNYEHEEVAEAWGEPNAEFIALARTALPKLAEAVYQVLARLDAEENRPNRITVIDGQHRPARVPTSEVRQAITDAMNGADQ